MRQRLAARVRIVRCTAGHLGGRHLMTVLRIEHPVPDFDRWKQAFESDPVDRRGSGVRRYTILRAVDDPHYVLIDLEFEQTADAEAMLGKLRDLWSRVDVMHDPRARVAEVVESRAL
jgi:hypothetical protein